MTSAPLKTRCIALRRDTCREGSPFDAILVLSPGKRRIGRIGSINLHTVTDQGRRAAE